MKKTLLIFATRFESRRAHKYLKKHKVQKNEIAPDVHSYANNLIIMSPGMGSPIATKRVKNAAALCKPERVILCGFCGACDPHLQLGDLLYESEIESINALCQSLGARAGKIYTAAELQDKEDKERLYAEKGVDALEMEAEIFFNAIKELGLQCEFAHLRCVSDTASMLVPKEVFDTITNFENGQIELSPIKITKLLLRKPSLIMGLIEFAKDIRKANSKYNEFIDGLLSGLENAR